MANAFIPQSPFEGFVYAKLEDMSNRLDTIKLDLSNRMNNLPCEKSDERTRSIEQKISKIEGKASVLGALSGFMVHLIIKLFSGK